MRTEKRRPGGGGGGPGKIAREGEALGGEINAYTSFDQTVYHITISGRYLENALDILADTLGNSVFDADELAREKEGVLEELRMNEDNPGGGKGKGVFKEGLRAPTDPRGAPPPPNRLRRRPGWSSRGGMRSAPTSTSDSTGPRCGTGRSSPGTCCPWSWGAERPP